ncbi:MAG: response regulator transcription factor [Saprospiraceae bacterium]|nr:response regulator transcription factor [Saprospiraceae bacterium]
MPPFTCIIVDDDEIDRLRIMSLVKKFASIRLLAAFENADDALLYLEKESVDILFLDIEMAGTSGIDLRKKAKQVPVCIFVTSYPEHAVESFELDTLDFIVKPINLQRFEQTIKRIEEYMQIRQKANLFESTLGGEAIFIKDGHNQIKIHLHDILYLEALKDYTMLVTNDKRHCILLNIGKLLNENKFNNFVRIHRSFAVQKHFVSKISTQHLELHNQISLPIGRSFKENITSLI